MHEDTHSQLVKLLNRIGEEEAQQFIQIHSRSPSEKEAVRIAEEKILQLLLQARGQ